MAIPDKVIDSGLPLPAVYKNRQVQAETAYQQALASIGGNQRMSMEQSGFTGDQGADGAMTNLRIDPTRQYSDVMNTLRGHAQNMHSLRQTLAGQGLRAGKGLAAKRANLLRYMQQGDVTNLGTSLQRTLADYMKQRGDAGRTRTTDYNSAESDAVQYAIANGLFNTPPAPGSQGYDVGGNQVNNEPYVDPGGGASQVNPGAAAPTGWNAGSYMVGGQVMNDRPAPQPMQQAAPLPNQSSYVVGGNIVPYDPSPPPRQQQLASTVGQTRQNRAYTGGIY